MSPPGRSKPLLKGEVPKERQYITTSFPSIPWSTIGKPKGKLQLPRIESLGRRGHIPAVYIPTPYL